MFFHYLKVDVAKRLFGDTNPVGQMLNSDRNLQMRVTGVLNEFPKNSHYQTDGLFSFSTLEAFSFYERDVLNDWQSSFYLTYLLLNKDADRNSLEAKITDAMRQKNSDDPAYNSSFILQQQPSWPLSSPAWDCLVLPPIPQNSVPKKLASVKYSVPLSAVS